MDTNVSLTAELERFARDCVDSGRFTTVSEVVRTGLRLLQDAEQRRAAFVASLDRARDEGLAAGLATAQEVEADVRAAIAVARQQKA